MLAATVWFRRARDEAVTVRQQVGEQLAPRHRTHWIVNMRIEDPLLADAARQLLGATGDGNYFGYVRRNASTGERELVCAVRGADADALLELLAEQHRPSWKRRLLDSLLEPPD